MPVHTLHSAKEKKNKFECSDKLHSVKHFRSLPDIMWIPSTWILNAFP